MKVSIDMEKCIGCGNCVSLTDSEIFDFNDEGLAECIVDDISEEKVEVTEEAIKYCPTEAIYKKVD